MLAGFGFAKTRVHAWGCQMIYQTGADYLAAKSRRVLLFGMSGLGKTHLSNMLRDTLPDQGGWFHYSVDYRIGTRYMNEYIADNFKREADRKSVV